MGQTLSEPVTAKETTSCANDRFVVGASSMQGWRVNMEDAHTHILSLAPEDPAASFFAVYDGHGGAKVAHYAGNHLHKKIVSHSAYQEGDIVEAISQGFLQIDQDMLSDPEMRDELAGTTAVCVLVKNGKLYCGNVGDSRAVVSLGGRADPLSLDHKPSNEGENKRIIAAGGWVEFNRVNGNLALSRALGDFVFKRNDKKDAKEQIVTAFPDVQIRDITEDLEFMVIACDGIWDVLTNEEVVDFVRVRIAAKMPPEVICEELMTRCLAPDCQMGGLGCDNMTVVLVCLVNGKTYDEYSVRCTQCPSSVRSTVHRNGLNSEGGSPLSSCSSSTPETPDEERFLDDDNSEQTIDVNSAASGSKREEQPSSPSRSNVE
ncbi:putative protein phosphatase 2C T23F11.1 [Halotydeus destructor]|nr:putative protein phosphatase 2C T23F11.1 [Halotydeus destructor]